MKTVVTGSQARPRPWLGILGVTIALSAPVVQAMFVPWLQGTFAFPADRFVSLWVFWIAMALALGIAHYAEGYPLARFGFRRTAKPLRARLIEWISTLLVALASAIVIIGTSTFLRSLLTTEAPPALEMARVLPYWVLIPAWATAAFVEEVLFRSYTIERLTDLTGKPWMAALIALVAFGLLHSLSWDWIHVLTVALPGSLVLTLVYLWRRNLATVVIIHGILNAPLLLLPLLASYM